MRVVTVSLFCGIQLPTCRHGGADSYNMLVPYGGCGETDKFAEYYTARGEIALAKESLLPITAQALSRNSTQVCSRLLIYCFKT